MRTHICHRLLALHLRWHGCCLEPELWFYQGCSQCDPSVAGGGMAMGLSCRGLWRWCSPDWRNSQIAPVSTGVMTSWCHSSMGVGGATAVWTSGGSCWCSHSLPVDRGFLQVARILPHTYPLKSDDPSNVRAVIVVTAVINDWEMD